MPIEHKDMTGNSVHVPYAGTYANENERKSATLPATAVGKLFLQLDNNSLWIPVSASPLAWKEVCISSRYELGEFYYFRHPTLKSGFQPAQGGLIQNANTRYPQIWAYLQTTEGRMLCKTETEWQAMVNAKTYTLADGTKVGWNGIGGAPFYVQNLSAGTLRMPDVRGMYPEAAGFDSLDVGGVHIDALPSKLVGTCGGVHVSGGVATGVFKNNGAYSWQTTANTYPDFYKLGFDVARIYATANKNQPRAWGALACCFLGQPTS